jgi:biotin synthase
LVKKVRLSLGTAIETGLVDGVLNPFFTTAFMMTYVKGRCSANCSFCPQACESTSASDRLSRISWPEFEFRSLLQKIPKTNTFRRFCIQSLQYPEVVADVEDIILELRHVSDLPISVSIHPVNEAEMRRFHRAGAASIGVAFDACTPELFNSVKGAGRGSSFRWESHTQALRTALDIFGKGKVTTHLMIGLGETEQEAATFLLMMKDLGVSVGLFAFTSVRGTSMEGMKSPELSSYRRLQVLRYLVAKGRIERGQIRVAGSDELRMDLSPGELKELLSSGEAFQTSGCDGCNRPYYNERPSGPMYNYCRPLTQDEVNEAIDITGLAK